jgi:hypothetical protein
VSRRDKIGLTILVALFAFLMGALIWTLRNAWKPTHDFSDSVIVKQRMEYLKK